MIDDDRHPRIAGFGASQFFEETSASSSVDNLITVRWAAPELLEHEESGRPRKTFSTDVYAFACLCFEVSSYILVCCCW